MAILFDENKQRFSISTKNTLYVFDVLKNKYLRHVYYGAKKQEVKESSLLFESFAPYVENFGEEYSPDTFGSEVSFFGAGDFRQNSLRINGFDGSSVSDFDFSSYEVFSGRKEIDGLPFARADEETETLKITLTDKHLHLTLCLYYTVFPKYDVISRYLTLQNNGSDSVKIEKCMSLEFTIENSNYDMISMYGSYGKELNFQRVPLHHGIQSVYSNRGASSANYNPFFAICSNNANSQKGEVYGFNFVYSGSFLNQVEVDGHSMTKVLVGLGSECFNFQLEVGETFESPEAICTFSKKGIDKMSDNFHHFVRDCIMPATAKQPHPIVLNTWEGSYFEINENILIKYAKEASKYGFDMLVMDDGWFGERNDDTKGLGDWFVNKNKFPNGLKYLIDNVRKTGLKFGIWVEPEMVNPNSDLYRKHPEWAISVKGREPLLSRNQLVLDMSNDEVVEYLKKSFDETFKDCEPDYFKWDMNRNMSNVCSLVTAPNKQGEVWFKYIKGVYKLFSYFEKRFPNAIIETCSGGGGRYDLGMMKYGFQVWTSDTTDPYKRIGIQSSALLGYPSLTMSCHVSNPQENLDSLDYRFKVAVCGMLGYELNITSVSENVKNVIKTQIEKYRTFEHLIREGLYREIASPLKYDYTAYYYVAKDKKEILFTFAEKQNSTNGKTKLLKIKEALDGVYVDALSGKEYFGKDLRKGISFEKTGKPFSAELFYFKFK